MTRSMQSLSELPVFIVDDNPGVCGAIEQTLQSTGYPAKTFQNAQDCLKKIALHSCRMVISDFKMPRMNGLEFLERIRQILPLLPVIIITGYGDVPLAVRAIKSGAHDFLEKPLKKDSLLQAVRRLDQSYEFLFSPDLEILSRKEKQILQFLIDGQSTEQIAEILFRSPRTIEDHRHNILQKLQVNNFAHLMEKIIPISENP